MYAIRSYYADQFLSDGQKYLEGLDVTESELTQIALYPNPIQDVLYITGLKEEVSYFILDLNGKVVLKGATSGQINMSSMASGIYQLVLTLDNSFIVITSYSIHYTKLYEL